MKKLFSIIFTVFTLCILSTATFAAQQPTTDTSAKTNLTVEQKAQKDAFKAQVQTLRDTLKENHQQNQTLREQNKTLVGQVKEKLSTLKSSETKLSSQTKTEIKAIKQQIATLRQEKAATKGEIKAILTANKTNINNMDFEAAQAAFKQAYDIQKLRFDKLTQINTKLNELLAAIK